MDVKGNLIVTGDVFANNVPDPDRFYLTVKQSDDAQAYSGVNLISFNTNDFYLNQNSPNIDEVNVNFRGSAGSGSTGVTFADGTRTFANSENLHFNSGPFYLSNTTGGQPVVNLREPVNTITIIATAQTVSAGSNADITWDYSERVENGLTWIPGAGDTTELTVPAGVDKIYLEVQVDWNSNTASDRNLIRVSRNGVFTAWHGANLSLITSNSQETDQVLSQRIVSDRLSVGVGDVIEVNGLNNSSSDRDILATSYIRIIDITQSGL
jgi:hypothetical protein